MIRASLFNKVLKNFSSNLLDDSLFIEKVVIDSREASQNSLFIAFEGKNIDGHNFVEKIG